MQLSVRTGPLLPFLREGGSQKEEKLRWSFRAGQTGQKRSPVAAEKHANEQVL